MEAGKQVKKLPMSLGDALTRLENDEVIKSAMPGEMYRLFTTNTRTTSGSASCTTVTELGHGDLPGLPALRRLLLGNRSDRDEELHCRGARPA